MQARLTAAFLVSIGLGGGASADSLPVLETSSSTNSFVDVFDFPVSAADYFAQRGNELSLSGIRIDGATTVSLELSRFDVFARGAQVVVETPNGTVQLDDIPVELYRGAIVGEPASNVFLSVSPYGVNGYVIRNNQTYLISSGPAFEGRPTMIFPLNAQNAAAMQLSPFVCGSDLLPHPQKGNAGSEGGAAGGSGPCRVAELAIETNQEFTSDLFGGDTSAAAAYAATLLAADSEIYRRDTNARLEISYLRLWTTTDPWTSDDTIGQLFQFQDYWNANMTGVSRNAAHFLSPLHTASAGGVAYLPGLCQEQYDYGLSAYIKGYFPYPLQNHNSQNWDVMVTSHELGHNFGARHTHDMSPPIDGCAFGDCSMANTGTIMSYCHVCDGGMSNIVLEFHPRTINEDILPYLDSLVGTCDLSDPLLVIDQPDSLSRSAGQTAVLSVTVNHNGASFQWLRNGVELTNGGRISGAASDTLTISNLEPGDAGNYSVDVSDECAVTSSDAAVLTIMTLIGDMNCDGEVNNFDIDPFVLALTDVEAYTSQYTACDAGNGDVNGDGALNNFDIDPFVALLTG